MPLTKATYICTCEVIFITHLGARINVLFMSMCLYRDMNPIDVEEWEDELGMMGFGYYDNSNQTSRILQYAEVKKKDSEQCYKNIRKKDELPPDWDIYKNDGFCILGDNSETCGKGDSGGPVIWTSPEYKNFLGCFHDLFLKCEKHF